MQNRQYQNRQQVKPCLLFLLFGLAVRYSSAFLVSQPIQQQNPHAFAVSSSATIRQFQQHEAVSSYTKQQHQSRRFKQDDMWKLNEIIRADVWNAEPFDIGQGGVRLATESAVKISGTVQHRPGKAEAKPLELLRFRELQSVPESTVTKVLHECKAELVCLGQGKELYKDPGSTTVKEVMYAPHEAARDALNMAGSVSHADRIVINVLGGDDLQLPEVIDALHFLVISLDANTKSKIFFNSLCHSSIPTGTTTVTVVSFPHVPAAVDEGEAQVTAMPLTGLWPAAEKAIAKGEVYARDGNWWTVVDADIDEALA